MKFKVIFYIKDYLLCLLIYLSTISFVAADVTDDPSVYNPNASTLTTDVIVTVHNDHYLPIDGVRCNFTETSGVTISKKGGVATWGKALGGPTSLYGAGISKYVTAPTFVTDYNHIAISVACGSEHMLALLSNGDVYLWGRDLTIAGHPPIFNSSIKIPYLETFKQIASAIETAYILDEKGYIYVVGRGENGEAANSKRSAHYTLGSYTIDLNGFPGKFRLIGAAKQGGYGVTKNGDVYAWGLSKNCHLGKANSSDNCQGTQIIDFANKLSISGINGNDIISIAGGSDYTYILTKQGDLYGLGNGSSIGKNAGTLYDSPVHVLSNVDSFCAGEDLSVALTLDSEIYTWGTAKNSRQAALGLFASSPTKRAIPTNKFNQSAVYASYPERVVKLDCFANRFHYVTNHHRIFLVGYGSAYDSDAGKTIPLLLDEPTEINLNDQPWPGKMVSATITSFYRFLQQTDNTYSAQH